MADKPDIMDPQRRIRAATRSLVKTRVQMEKYCNDVIRLFRDNPIAMNAVCPPYITYTSRLHARRFFIFRLSSIV